ncbi:MAG: LacI family DNA-binding transcriptional regulator [Planctomycetota bacterium]
MTTVRDIASALGVSPATVSRSLNHSGEVREDLRNRVLLQAKRMGYQLPTRRTQPGAIGICFLNEPAGPRFSGYDAVIWSGVARAARAHKLDLTTLDLQDRSPGESVASFLRTRSIEGLVLRVDNHTRDMATDLAGHGIPVVVVAEQITSDDLGYVYCNSRPQSYAAVEHLIHLGHRRIAVAVNSVLDRDHQDRLEAYREALAAYAIEPDPDLEIVMVADLDGGAAAVSRFMSLPSPPTAIFFTDPTATVGAMRRTLELGIRVPEELSIVGFDDEQSRCFTFPKYTAVCQPAADLGFAAGRWLAREIVTGRAGRSEPVRLELQAFFEVNYTTGPPCEPVRVLPDGSRLQVEEPASTPHTPPDHTQRRSANGS